MNKFRFSSFVWIAIFTLHSIANATGLSGFESLQNKLERTVEEPSFQVFYTSTEMQISRAKPIIDQAPSGLYLTVGSDRGFRAASLSPKITELLLLDLSPSIVRYSRINIQLLKSPSLSEYRKLRWDASYQDWQRFALAVNKKKKTKVQLSKDDFEWWKKNVRNLESYSYYPLPEMLNRFGKDLLVERFLAIYEKLKTLVHDDITQEKLFFASTFENWQEYSRKVESKTRLEVEDWEWWKKFVGDGKNYAYAQAWAKDINTLVDFGKIIDFKSGNYLYREDLYLRLHQMATKNKIATLLIDLSKNKNVELLTKQMKQSGLTLSVLDLDNTYDSYYMGNEAYMNLLNPILNVGLPNSILLTMRNFKNYGSGQFSTYVGFTFENVKHWPKDFQLQKFFDHLPNELADLINGRLFEASEMPPAKLK